MSTDAAKVTGTVRIAKSFPAPSPMEIVSVFLADDHKTLTSQEFRAADVAKTPKEFSFPVSEGTQYHVWAKVGTVESDWRYFTVLSGQEPPRLDFVFGSD